MVPKLFFCLPSRFSLNQGLNSVLRNAIFLLTILAGGNLSCGKLYGQSALGAATTAMGATSATATGIWSLNSNPAGITAVKRPSLGVDYSTVMNLPELSSQSAVFVLPSGKSKFGFGVERYGFNGFNQLHTGFVYGKQFGNSLSIATKFNYHQVSAANYGVISNFSFNVGIRYVFTNKIALGAYITNPSQQEYPSDLAVFPIPSVYAAGLSWQSSDQVLFAVTFLKGARLPLDFRTGLDYCPGRIFSLTLFDLRGGVSIHPLRHYAGFGITRQAMDLAFAVTSDPHFGYRPQISMGYAW